MYRNEAAFSKALVQALRHHGWFVQRIESGETGKGIPDIYAIAPNKQAFWFELKCMRRANTEQFESISWRPGQQSWLNEVTRRGQNAYTLAAFNNGIIQIPHHVIWAQNIIDVTQCFFYSCINDLFKR